ncbi:MAG: DNA cytosine methyltransferase [Oscillospiraceae bacterium]
MLEITDDYKKALEGYRFIDLFCGIGGFHLALSSFGAKCVFASDIDNEARKIYKRNFGIEPKGDIKLIKEETEIPAHDILCGGFPCQAFSISGTQAGFEDEKTGKLFFEIIRIAKQHKPQMILLENVANLEFHDGGKTINRILEELRQIGYSTHEKILCATDYNIPQCRRRLYIVAYRTNLNVATFTFPKKIPLTRNLSSVLEAANESTKSCEISRDYHLRDNYQHIEAECKKLYIRIGEIGLGRQGERIYSVKGCATTLSSSGGGLGGRTGIYLIDGKIRKLTPRECARLMGFPDTYKIAETHNQAYQQFGNSVVVDVLQQILIQTINALRGGQP